MNSDKLNQIKSILNRCSMFSVGLKRSLKSIRSNLKNIGINKAPLVHKKINKFSIFGMMFRLSKGRGI